MGLRILFKVSLFCLFLSFLTACTKDEAETTGGVSGLLTRADNGEPVPNANMSLNPGGKSATTGSDGRYEFANLEPGQYTVQALCEGFKTNTKQITVTAGEIVSGDMQLSPGTEDFSLSVPELRFGPGSRQKTFEIINRSVSKSISWHILDSYPSWLSVSESRGTLPKDGRRSVVVTLTSSPAVGSEGYITVEAGGSTQQIYVFVQGESSKTGGISGLVCSRNEGKVLSGANVTLSPGGQSVTTGSDGKYEFSDLIPGKYTVMAVCKGYKSESKGITVTVGNVAGGDLQLSPEVVDFTLSESRLDFSAESTVKAFNIINSGDTWPVDWQILSGYPDWLFLSETGGTLSPGGQRAITVTLRSVPSTDKEGYITVEAGGSTKQVYVVFTAAGSGGGGDTPGGGGEGGTEDYSSVVISQCDTRLNAAVVSCRRLGTTVVFTCRLTNTGLGEVNDFRIYPPSSGSLISGGVRSVITDDQGNEYPGATISFRNGSASASHTANGSLPEGVACQCVVTVSGVSESVKKLTLVKLGVYAYPDSQFHLVNKYIDFKNVPVY